MIEVRDHRLLEDETESVLMRLSVDELVQLLSNAGPTDRLRDRLKRALNLLEPSL